MYMLSLERQEQLLRNATLDNGGGLRVILGKKLLIYRVSQCFEQNRAENIDVALHVILKYAVVLHSM